MNIWQLFMLLRWSLWLHFTPMPHQSYLLCDKQGFLITNPFMKVMADVKEWLRGTLLLLYSNAGAELQWICAPPTWSDCFKHMEREGGISSGQSSISNTIGSNLGIRTWVVEEGPLREQWTRILRPPSSCPTQWMGMVRSREVKASSHRNMLTWGSGVEWRFSFEGHLTDEQVSRSLLAVMMRSGRITIWFGKTTME